MLKNKLSYNTLIIGINPSECHEVAREIVDEYTGSDYTLSPV